MTFNGGLFRSPTITDTILNSKKRICAIKIHILTRIKFLEAINPTGNADAVVNIFTPFRHALNCC